jgi:peptidoglycan-associated lipoprotein
MYLTQNTPLGIIGLVVSLAWLSGCPKSIPQPELDAAQQAFVELEKTKDCAREKYLAARTSMDQAQALLKEKRYEEAKTALLAARKLAQEAHEECERKAKEASQAKHRPDTPSDTVKINTQPKDQTPQKMETVYFEFNVSSVSDEARQTLEHNADYIRNKGSIRVQLEGHCDDKGSTEYNLALGERRAMSVKQYLIKMGINAQHFQIISFGEERPVHEDDSKNRRVEFRKNP